MSTATSPDGPTTPLARRGANTGRLIGIDLARGTVVIGMFTVHAPPTTAQGGLPRGASGIDLATVPTTGPDHLLMSTPHSGTTSGSVGSTAVAVAALGAYLYAERFSRAFAAVGALPSTSYVGQCFLLRAFGAHVPKPAFAGHPVVRRLLLVAATVVFTTVGRRSVGRGPLDWGLHHLPCVPTRRTAV